MAKKEKQEKQAKKPRQKRQKRQKPFIRPWVMISLFAWLMSAVIIVYIEIVKVPTINEKSVAANTNNIKINVAHNIEKAIQQTQQTLDTIAQSVLLDNIYSPDIKPVATRNQDTPATVDLADTLEKDPSNSSVADESSTGQGDAAQSENATINTVESTSNYSLDTEDLIKNAFTFAESVRIIPWDHSGTAGLKQKKIDFKNNIELMMVAHAGDGRPVPPEAFKYNGTWYVNFVSPVTRNDKTSSVLLLTLNSRFFNNAITIPSIGESARISVHLKGHEDDIANFGTAQEISQTAIQDLPFADGRLKIEFNSDKVAELSTSFIYTYALLLFLPVIITTIAFLGYFRNVKIIREDLTDIKHYAKSLSGLHKTKKPDLNIKPLLSILNAMDVIAEDNAKSALVPADENTGQTPSPQSGPPPEKLGTAVVNDDNSFPHPHIFRDYDIRGIADQELSNENVNLIAKAIGSEIIASGQNEVIIGYDGRLSSERIKKAVIKGLLSTGCNVTSTGLVPSPVLYHSVSQSPQKNGIMITGSHNPPEYNGLKIVIGNHRFHGDRLKQLLDRIKDYNFESGDGKFTEIDNNDSYIEAALEDIFIAQPVKVIFDAGNGAAGQIISKLSEKLDCETELLYCDIDGNFPNHGPDPSDENNLADLIAAVKDNQANMGLAFDGDADRLVAVTAQGKIIAGDQLLLLFARDIALRNPACSIVYDVKCSRYLDSEIAKAGAKAVMCKSGHANIKSSMEENQALFGGELTGHYFFADNWNGHDDGIYSALRLIELVAADEKNLDQQLAELPQTCVTPDLRMDLASEEQKDSLMATLKAAFSNLDGKLVEIDGLRLEQENAWGLIRPSNTSTAMTLRFEGDTEEALQQIKGIFKLAIQEADDTLLIPF